jgi:hypothetical protein
MNFQKKNFVDGSFYLYEMFKKDEPFATGKIGGTELITLHNYLLFEHKKQPVTWYPNVVQEIYINSGVFPQTNEALTSFVHEMLAALPSMDSLCWWSMINLDFEGRVIKHYSPQCELLDLQSLEPFYFGCPWTEHLKDKNVLVISPFTDTIQKQYKKRKQLWQDSRILPDFNLKVLKHPPSTGISKTDTKYNNWLEMVKDFKNQMSDIDYDIALIGTGASSLPLVAHAKKMKKKAIHLGGPLQILFGIKGTRWDGGPIGKHFYNDYWVRPSSDETPQNYKNNEGGCYW